MFEFAALLLVATGLDHVCITSCLGLFVGLLIIKFWLIFVKVFKMSAL